MLSLRTLFVLGVCVKGLTGHKPLYVQLEQIHIAYGEDPTTQMTVSWATRDPTPTPMVYYGETLPEKGVPGSSRYFVDGGKKKLSQYFHDVRLTGLKPATKYVYRCGSDLGWSEEFSFQTANASEHWEVKVVVYGDMGVENAKALPALQVRRDGHYDAVIHVGDFAYDMDSKNGQMGDQFMRQIEPIAAYVPYMVCPGNHEQAYNFSHYRARFSMPGNTENLYYSFNMGPVHFISINTEAYYFVKYGIKILVNQYNWLVNDLKIANQPENREKRPWIVVYGHKPMYCSNFYREDCSYNTTRTRIGMPGFQWFGMEQLFYENGVDLALWGHEHSYERMWPIYDYEVRNGSAANPYFNPRAPVHITSGSAGCNEYLANFTKIAQPWSAVRILDYGFLTLRFANKSHLHVEQLSAEKDEIVDEIWIVKESHGSYS